MNTAILYTQPKRGLGCACGCNHCSGSKPLAGTLDYLYNTQSVGKKAVGILSVVAFGFIAYKILTL